MYKVIVRVPATVNHLGAGLNILSLALSLHAEIEVRVQREGALTVHMQGEGADVLPANYQNLVVRAASRVFQAQERAPVGLEIFIRNAIPLGAGLSAEQALLIGGLVAANNLLDTPFDREGLVNLALTLGVPLPIAQAALLGGLNLAVDLGAGRHLTRNLEPPPLRIIALLPDLPTYAEETRAPLPPMVRLEDAVFNLGRLPFLMEALVAGDFNLLEATLQDRLFQSAYTRHITGYAEALAAARQHGAKAVCLAGLGPTLLVFAPYNHALIADSMGEAFRKAGVKKCRTWTLGIDAQGVTVSVAS